MDVRKNIASLLRNMMEDSEVYSFGISGAPLSQYYQMSRYAGMEFSPDILVFVLVHNDFDESIYQYEPKPEFLQIRGRPDTIIDVLPVKPNKSKLRQWLRFLNKSALLSYLEKNLQITSLNNLILQHNGKEQFNANVKAATIKERKYFYCY